MTFAPPTVPDFKSYFTRDFPYGSTTDLVMDSDIQRAIDLASTSFNDGLFGDVNAQRIAFFYLSAHQLVTQIRESSGGLSSQFNWNAVSKSGGSVSESYQIPDIVQNSALFSIYGATRYGVRYLEMILPLLCGAMFTVYGDTNS